MRLSLCLILVSLASTANLKTKEEWKSRIIYHILTDRFSRSGDTPTEQCSHLRSWCGGSFKGIQQRLDYIKGLGANAVSISPLVLNTPGGYHGYWAKNIYEIEPHWGTRQDLQDLIATAHAKDVWIMVGVVPNHMGYPQGCSKLDCPDDKAVNFTGLVPFDKEEHYHTLCQTTDWDNQTQVERCRLANLPDLNQTVPYVRQTLLDWITNLTAEFDIDGYRVDTVKNIEISFWSEYQQAAKAFLMGEVWHGEPRYCAPYQLHMNSLFNYPMYHALKDVFNKGQAMTRIQYSLTEQRENFPDVSVLGTIIDNHDNVRFLNLTSDVQLLRNAITYIVMGQGIPVIYYGTEQEFSGGSDPHNRESLWPHYDTNSIMYQFISLIGKHRLSSDHVKTGPQVELHVDDESFIFARGDSAQEIVALTNKRPLQNITKKFSAYSSMKNGNVYSNVFDGSDQVNVTSCQMVVTLKEGEPKVYTLITEGTGDTCGASDMSTTQVVDGGTSPVVDSGGVAHGAVILLLTLTLLTSVSGFLFEN